MPIPFNFGRSWTYHSALSLGQSAATNTERLTAHTWHFLAAAGCAAVGSAVLVFNFVFLIRLVLHSVYVTVYRSYAV